MWHRIVYTCLPSGPIIPRGREHGSNDCCQEGEGARRRGLFQKSPLDRSCLTSRRSRRSFVALLRGQAVRAYAVIQVGLLDPVARSSAPSARTRATAIRACPRSRTSATICSRNSDGYGGL